MNGTNYNGSLPDSFSASHDGMLFSTKDSDNDLAPGNCAVQNRGKILYPPMVSLINRTSKAKLILSCQSISNQSQKMHCFLLM